MNSVFEHQDESLSGAFRSSHESTKESKRECKNDDLDEIIPLSFRHNSTAVKDKLWRFLLEHHVDSPELKYVMAQRGSLCTFTKPLEDLAAAIESQSPDKSSRGAALHVLADGYANAAEFVATMNSLGLNVKDCADLLFPTMSSGDCAAALGRWEGLSAESLRDRAIQYAKDIQERYGGVKLYAPTADEGGALSYQAAGTVGKRAKSILLSMRNAAVGVPFSQFDISDLSGNPVSLRDQQGKVVIFYIWSPHCGPCKDSLPLYGEMVTRIKEAGCAIELITLSVNDDDDELLRFISENQMPFINCRIGYGSRFLYEWRIGAFPTTILVDRNGVVRAKGVLGKAFLHFLEEKILRGMEVVR